MAEDGFHMPLLDDEEARCTRATCGHSIKKGRAFYSLIGLPYCSQECIDIYYRQIGIYDLVHKDLAERTEEELEEL